MSVTIHEASIRSQSAANPTHEAAAGVLHLNTAGNAVFVQMDEPTGDNWQAIKQGFNTYAVNNGYERWENARSYTHV